MDPSGNSTLDDKDDGQSNRGWSDMAEEEEESEVSHIQSEEEDENWQTGLAQNSGRRRRERLTTESSVQSQVQADNSN